MKKILVVTIVLLFVFAQLNFITEVQADDVPIDGPITIVVGFDPGGGHDAHARAITSVSGQYFDVPVVIENRPGASGTIGAEHVLNSEPDGRTLLSATSAPLIYSTLIMDTGYDFLEDAEVIGKLGVMTAALAVNAELPFETIEELLEYVAENPRELTFASGGAAFEVLNILLREEGYDLRLLPYPGGRPASTAAASGEADVVVGSVAGILPFHEDGSLRMLMTVPELEERPVEDVPSIGEKPEIRDILGIWPGIATQGVGIYGPKGISEERLDYLENVLYQVSQDEGFKATMRRLGLDPIWEGREESSRILEELYKTVIEMKEELQ